MDQVRENDDSKTDSRWGTFRNFPPYSRSRYTKEVEALHPALPVTTSAPLTQAPPPHMTMTMVTSPPPPPPPVVAPPPPPVAVSPQGVMAPWPPITQPPPVHPPPHSAVSYY